MTDKLVLEDHLSLRDQYFTSRSFLLYWWIKRKAIELGRIKSCRAMKVMKPKTKEEINVYNMVESVGTSVSREHAKNIKFILEDDEYIKDASFFTEVNLETRRGRVKVVCSPTQAKANLCLKLIHKNSNVPSEALRANFLDESSTSFFCFYYTGFRSVASSIQNMRDDYGKIDGFVEKLKNTIALVNKVGPHIPNVDTYEWWMPNREDLKIDFTGVTDDDLSADAILKSEMVISPRSQDSVTVPGNSIPAVQRVRRVTAQDRLNQYVQNVIMTRRENED